MRDKDQTAPTRQRPVARGQRCRWDQGVPSCGGVARQTLLERRGAPFAASRMFVALALQMHLPSSLGSSCNFPSRDGSRWIPQAQACERKARWAPAARTPDRRLGRSIRHCSLLLFPSTLVLSTPVFRARISSIPMLSPVHSAKRTRLFRRANPSCVSRLHNRTHSVSIQRKNRSSRLI